MSRAKEKIKNWFSFVKKWLMRFNWSARRIVSISLRYLSITRRIECEERVGEMRYLIGVRWEIWKRSVHLTTKCGFNCIVVVIEYVWMDNNWEVDAPVTKEDNSKEFCDQMWFCSPQLKSPPSHQIDKLYCAYFCPQVMVTLCSIRIIPLTYLSFQKLHLKFCNHFCCRNHAFRHQFDILDLHKSCTNNTLMLLICLQFLQPRSPLYLAAFINNCSFLIFPTTILFSPPLHL